MLKLNVNQEKQLTFEVQIGGVQTEQVSSYLRIEIDKVEYGFPAVVGRESITVNLPPLRSVTARSLKEGEEVQVKLDIIADGNLLTPWQDTFRLGNPLVIEAKIVDADFNEPIAFRTKLVTEGKPGKSKQGLRLEKVAVSEVDEEDALTEKIVNKLAEKLAGKKLSEMDDEKDAPPAPDGDEGEDEGEDEGKEEVAESSRISSKDLLDMTKEGVYAYMERAGTANPTIQKLIYEQAEAAAQSSRPVAVLRQVVKMLKTKKS